MKPNFTPTEDRVLIERIIQESELKIGSIHIPECAQGQVGKLEDLSEGGGGNWFKGVVIAVGPGKKTDDGRLPMEVKPGDIVMFSGRWNDASGLPKNQVLIREADIAGFVPDESCDRSRKGRNRSRHAASRSAGN